MKKSGPTLTLLLLLAAGTLFGQEEKQEPPTVISIDAEFRIRSEVRYGYRNPPTADSRVAAFIGQRSRLNLNFASKVADARISVQDIRTWGELGPGDRKGVFMLHEGLVVLPVRETGLSFKLGRQELEYDNGRLISGFNWRQEARSHDAAVMRLKKKNTDLHVIAAYNQPGESVFGRDFYATNNYKLLNVLWLKQKAGEKVTFSLLNLGDGMQADTSVAALKDSKKLFYRLTHFGRLEFFAGKSLYLTSGGAIQYGKNNKDQQILAWYVQPEIRYSGIKKLTLTAGAEIMSGEDATKPFEKINSFSTLYGVGHKFNGYMDLYTTFPGDVGGGGLINPYLLIHISATDKLTLMTHFHAFTHAANFIVDDKTLKKYLGFETDLVLQYRPHKILGLEVGYSIYKGSSTSVAVKGGETNRPGHWGYVQLLVKPEFFRFVR